MCRLHQLGHEALGIDLSRLLVLVLPLRRMRPLLDASEDRSRTDCRCPVTTSTSRHSSTLISYSQRGLRWRR